MDPGSRHDAGDPHVLRRSFLHLPLFASAQVAGISAVYDGLAQCKVVRGLRAVDR